jgi:hypothetical protein
MLINELKTLKKGTWLIKFDDIKTLTQVSKVDVDNYQVLTTDNFWALVHTYQIFTKRRYEILKTNLQTQIDFLDQINENLSA